MDFPAPNTSWVFDYPEREWIVLGLEQNAVHIYPKEGLRRLSIWPCQYQGIRTSICKSPSLHRRKVRDVAGWVYQTDDILCGHIRDRQDANYSRTVVSVCSDYAGVL